MMLEYGFHYVMQWITKVALRLCGFVALWPLASHSTKNYHHFSCNHYPLGHTNLGTYDVISTYRKMEVIVRGYPSITFL